MEIASLMMSEDQLVTKLLNIASSINPPFFLLSQTAQVGSKSHFLGQSDITVHFGVGEATKLMSIVVSWPRLNKKVQIHNVGVNQLFKIVPPEL